MKAEMNLKRIKKTGQRYKKIDKIDLLVFTDGPVKEERSNVGVTFVVRKIKNDQIGKLRSVDYSRKYMLFFSSKNAALKSDLK